MSINKAIFSGNIGRDPELRTTQSGTDVLTFSVAVNDRVPDGNNGWKDKANWVDVVVFGKRAVSLSNILRSGMKVMVDGKLSYSSYEKDGHRRSKLEVIAADIDIASSKKNDAQGQASEPAPEPSPDASVYDEDIPF